MILAALESCLDLETIVFRGDSRLREVENDTALQSFVHVVKGKASLKTDAGECKRCLGRGAARGASYLSLWLRFLFSESSIFAYAACLLDSIFRCMRR